VRAALVTHGRSGTAEHYIWLGIIQRCENQNNALYYHYGKRGISICDRWRYSFASFMADMGPRPSRLHSVDRYPNKNGNYEPGNCRWATDIEQARNQITNRIICYRGKQMTLAEASQLAGLKYDTVWMRLKHGWTIDRALETPARALRRSFKSSR
jgi:hypothetical protein